MRQVGDDERRARLARRHLLAEPGGGVVAAVRAVVCLHATEPAAVYLAAAARTGCSRADVDAALYDDRSVVRNLAMRRTVFGFPRELVPAAFGSASARVAQQQRKRLAVEAATAGARYPEAWAEEHLAAVLDLLGAHGPLPTVRIRELLPGLDLRVSRGRGQYQAQVPMARPILVTLDAQGLITRGPNTQGWRVSRPAWARTTDWLGEQPERLSPAEGYAALVRAWLERFGPGTEADLVWWLGATKAAVRRALADVDAVEVGLDGGGTGWLLPDDVEPVDAPEPWAALLPALDPTTMGWKERGFYLGEHAERLFDRNGNGGPTAWWDGRIVGGWRQDEDGRVVVVPAERLPRTARAALDERAAALTAWLDGDVVRSVYQSPLARAAGAAAAG